MNTIEMSDQLCVIKQLVEAIFMAATAIGDREHTAAIQRIAECAHREINELEAMPQSVRDEQHEGSMS